MVADRKRPRLADHTQNSLIDKLLSVENRRYNIKLHGNILFFRSLLGRLEIALAPFKQCGGTENLARRVSQKNVDIGFRAVRVRESFGHFRGPRMAIGQPAAEPHDGGGQRRRVLRRKNLSLHLSAGDAGACESSGGGDDRAPGGDRLGKYARSPKAEEDRVIRQQHRIDLAGLGRVFLMAEHPLHEANARDLPQRAFGRDGRRLPSAVLELNGEIRVEAVCTANFYRLRQKVKSLFAFGIAKKTERRPARARRRRLGVAKGHGQDPCLDPILIAIYAGDRFVFGREEERFADHRPRQREGLPIEALAELAVAPPWRPTWREHQMADDPRALAIRFRAQSSDQSKNLVLRYGGRDDELVRTPYIRRQSGEIPLIRRVEDSCAPALRGNSRVESAAARQTKESQQQLIRGWAFALVEGAAEMRERADLRDDHGVDGFHPEDTISHPATGQSLSYQLY